MTATVTRGIGGVFSFIVTSGYGAISIVAARYVYAFGGQATSALKFNGKKPECKIAGVSVAVTAANGIDPRVAISGRLFKEQKHGG